MKSVIATILVLLTANCSAFGAEHSATGTSYGAAGATAYEQSRHGPDGAVFLDPYFTYIFDEMDGKQVLDAGCGAGPWSIAAAHHGALVCGIDIQDAMITKAKDAAIREGVDAKTVFVQGSVDALPYGSDTFDVALSINVGCNLPNGVFDAHFEEIYRTLKPGGKVVVTAPASFGAVFTDAASAEFATQHITDVLGEMGSTPSSDEIVTGLNALKEVMRATFAVRNGRLTLITDERDLVAGEDIWRKIPGLAVPNRYQPEDRYVDAALRAELSIDRIDGPTGSHNGLCAAYETHPAFVIFHFSKKS